MAKPSIIFVIFLATAVTIEAQSNKTTSDEKRAPRQFGGGGFDFSQLGLGENGSPAGTDFSNLNLGGSSNPSGIDLSNGLNLGGTSNFKFTNGTSFPDFARPFVNNTCLIVPLSMAHGKIPNVPPGCHGAVFDNGMPAEAYCFGYDTNGNADAYPWWRECCRWIPKQFIPPHGACLPIICNADNLCNNGKCDKQRKMCVCNPGFKPHPSGNPKECVPLDWAPPPPPPGAAPPAPRTATTTEKSASCSDIWSAKKCGKAKNRGRCNRAKVAENCKETCDKC